MLPADQLTELAQALLGSSDFCEEYRHNYSEYGLNRRNEIVRTLDDLGFDKPDIEDREQLRRYFDELWQLPKAQYRTESADWSQIGTVYFEIGSKLPNRDSGPWHIDHQTAAMCYTRRVDLEYLKSLFPKETIMNNAATSTPITVTTQVLINGKLASQYSDADLFQSIALQEKAIKELDDIENKPASLVDEIAARKAGIQALVTYLDSRPKK